MYTGRPVFMNFCGFSDQTESRLYMEDNTGLNTLLTIVETLILSRIPVLVEI